MRGSTSVLAVIVVALGLAAPAALPGPTPRSTAVAAAETPASFLDVTVRDRRLSVAVTGVPLVSILRVIAEQAGFTLWLEGDLTAPVTRTFSNVPLDDGIRRLARGQSLGFVYAPHPPTGSVRLSELWVIASAPAPRPRTPVERAARLRAVSLLALQPGDAALAELTAILQRDADASLRSAAAAALGRRRDPRAAAALRAALHDANSLVRSTAARSLALLEAAPRR